MIFFFSDRLCQFSKKKKKGLWVNIFLANAYEVEFIIMLKKNLSIAYQAELKIMSVKILNIYRLHVRGYSHKFFIFYNFHYFCQFCRQLLLIYYKFINESIFQML